MAVDRERLFTYFQDHYFARQDVFARLPRNLPADSFWSELVQQRKMHATILPLSDSRGAPYWYVLTPRMIHASEILSEEAMRQEGLFDPYLAQMTSAMTEEMFFTSFVEGAQISLADAMEFLQRGTEPENIQEQMIWNNRHAWTAMIASLYHPLDEHFIKSLAFMLTDEMDQCAVDYRKSDVHEIAAMQQEPYELPPAISIPEKMQDFYVFLQNGQIHPLIKSAIGQAYPLVIRPFPEGNERLSRMISSAVLLRSGYDFFRDISLSSIIAKENYRYYKCMQEILREENDGDLTYFIEYFLDLLVRALEEKKRRDLKKHKDALELERSFATQPLRDNAPAPASSFSKSSSAPSTFPEPQPPTGLKMHAPNRPDTHESNSTAGFNPSEGVDMDYGFFPLDMTPNSNTRIESPSAPEDKPADDSHSPPPEGEISEPITTIGSFQIPDHWQSTFRDFFQRVRQLADPENTHQLPSKLRAMVHRGLFRFKIQQWCKHLQLTEETGIQDCRLLTQHSFLTKDSNQHGTWFIMRIDGPFSPTDLHLNVLTSDIPPNYFIQLYENKLKNLENFSSSRTYSDAGKTLQFLLTQGICQFTRKEWRTYSNLSGRSVEKACDFMLKTHLVVKVSPHHTNAVYQLNLSEKDLTYLSTRKPASIVSVQMMDRLKELRSSEGNLPLSRIGTFLLEKIQKGINVVCFNEWIERFDIKRATAGNDIRQAVALGILKKSNDTQIHGAYKICQELETQVRSNNLTQTQKQYLSRLYQRFGDKEFSLAEMSDYLQIKTNTLQFHILNFAQRGLFKERKYRKEFLYHFAIFPDTNPECFVSIDSVDPPTKEITPNLPRLEDVMSMQSVVSSAS